MPTKQSEKPSVRWVHDALTPTLTHLRVSTGGNEMDMNHVCSGPRWDEYDAQGIYLCRVCNGCVDEKLGKYRPEILTGYTQADVDEPIEEEE